MASVPTSLGTEVDDAPWPERRNAAIALGLLMAGAVVSQIDRGVINLLVEPIKAEYGLSDTQFGALQSIAFGTCYILMSIPIGILADRVQRRHVLACGIGLFSIFSVFSGLARSYTQLFIARMGVGVGEASLQPAGYSLISDLFPKDRLGRAISLFTMCNYVGASVALAFGGLLFSNFEIMVATSGTILGLKSWQLTIVAASLPGLLLAPAYLLLREPPRRGTMGKTQDQSFIQTLHELRDRRQFLLPVVAAMSVATMMGYAILGWMPALFIRVYGWSAATVGLWLGLSILVSAVFGSYLAGWISDRQLAKGRHGASIVISAISFVGLGFFGIIAPLMPSAELSLACFLAFLMFKPMSAACIPLSLQLIIPNHIRAQTMAIYGTIISLVGLGSGPLIVGILTDYLFSDPSDVRYSLSLMAAVTTPIAAILLIISKKPFTELILSTDSS